jgi:hypothetical protein
MHFARCSRCFVSALLFALALQGAAAQSARNGQLEFNFSPYTYHFSPSPDHKPVWLLGLTQVQEDGTLIAGAVFSNSFGQPSGAVQYGRRYLHPFGHERWYVQWTAGVMYGYVEPYQNKVPLNYKGFSPVIVPSAGYQFTRKLSGELMLLGNSALMFQLAYDLPE